MAILTEFQTHIEEKHITNIKRPPLFPPVLDMNYDIERLDNSGNLMNTNSQHTYMNWWGTLDGVVTDTLKVSRQMMLQLGLLIRQ